jgi:hypothetical protein
MPGTRFTPLSRDIDLLIRQDLSPEAQSATLAAFARETLAEVEAGNEAALGHPTPHETYVDGRSGASESTVRPGGTIVYEFDLLTDLFAWIDEQLRQHSPVGKGRDQHPGLYQKSHIFYADDVEADPLSPPPGIRVGTFVNATPYARKIEDGQSPQAPDGVYEVVTALASRRFGNIARVQFGYRTAVGGSVLNGPAGNKSAGRNPAIIVTVR